MLTSKWAALKSDWQERPSAAQRQKFWRWKSFRAKKAEKWKLWQKTCEIIGPNYELTMSQPGRFSKAEIQENGSFFGIYLFFKRDCHLELNNPERLLEGCTTRVFIDLETFGTFSCRQEEPPFFIGSWILSHVYLRRLLLTSEEIANLFKASGGRLEIRTDCWMPS